MKGKNKPVYMYIFVILTYMSLKLGLIYMSFFRILERKEAKNLKNDIYIYRVMV